MEVVCIDGTVIEADKCLLDKSGVTLQGKWQQQGQSKQQNQSQQGQSEQNQNQSQQGQSEQNQNQSQQGQSTQQSQSRQQQQTYETIGFVQYERLRYIADAGGEQIQTRQRSSSKQQGTSDQSEQKTGAEQAGTSQHEKGEGTSKKLTGDQLAIKEMQVNAPGIDDWNKNKEYLVFTNTGRDPLELSGCTVSNEADRTYRFPDGVVVAPGETITLHSGSGDNTDAELYWNADQAIWKNDADTITVKNNDGDVVLQRSYP